MIFIAIAILMLCFGKWYGERRERRWCDAWIKSHFGEVSLADRLRIHRLYFPSQP
jgi:hypothetical protein